jgi:hypothetical protein
LEDFVPDFEVIIQILSLSMKDIINVLALSVNLQGLEKMPTIWDWNWTISVAD